jgi:hypothetical protein
MVLYNILWDHHRVLNPSLAETSWCGACPVGYESGRQYTRLYRPSIAQLGVSVITWPDNIPRLQNNLWLNEVPYFQTSRSDVRPKYDILLSSDWRENRACNFPSNFIVFSVLFRATPISPTFPSLSLALSLSLSQQNGWRKKARKL